MVELLGLGVLRGAVELDALDPFSGVRGGGLGVKLGA